MVLGCSQNKLAPARVSGSLTYKNQPIKAGSMHFHTPDGVAYPATISQDGTYSASDIPEGEMIVTVETESIGAKETASKSKTGQARAKMGQPPPPGVAASMPSRGELYVKIPQKYSNPKTSPLTVTLKSGRQVHNIDLTD
jgi:hypothetical protein